MNSRESLKTVGSSPANIKKMSIRCEKMLRKTILALMAVVLMAACQSAGENPVPRYESVDEEGWEKSRAVRFGGPEKGEWTTLHLRTSAAFPFTQLVLEICHEGKKDTLTVDVPPARGNALTETAVPLPQTVKKDMSIRYLLTTNVLPGVCEIGVD